MSVVGGFGLKVLVTGLDSESPQLIVSSTLWLFGCELLNVIINVLYLLMIYVKQNKACLEACLEASRMPH